jgi:hypothetical protein
VLLSLQFTGFTSQSDTIITSFDLIGAFFDSFRASIRRGSQPETKTV